jgi:hypothetical protein
MMRISLRNAAGAEVACSTADDGGTAVFSAMQLLSKLTVLRVGDLLTVDGDNVPKMDDPKVQPVISADNLVAVAGRAEVYARQIQEQQPARAADILILAKLARHAITVRWIYASVSLNS